MLPLTRKFLEKTHEAFDELGYHPSGSTFSYEELLKCAVNTLNHTSELEDAINATRMLQFVIKNYDKIESKVASHYDYWESLKFEGNELISIVDDEEAKGKYFITNALFSNYKEIYLCSPNFSDNNIYGVTYKGGKFYIDDGDPQYFLRFSKVSDTKMVLLDKDGNKLCILVLSKDMNVFLENNNTDYDIVLYDFGMGVYDKAYIKSLHGEEPDLEQLKATIEWDILDKNSQYGLALLTHFDGDDLVLFLMFAMSCFLLFRSYMNQGSSLIFTTAMINTYWRRR